MNVLTRAVEKAGRALIRDFGEIEQLQVSRKGPGDFVSQADFKAEKILFEELSKVRPDYGFLMEEGGARPGKDPDHLWIIDPLDGTMNFLHGVPYWCVSVGLTYKNELIAGVVFNPISDEMFWAEKGQGAFVNSQRLRVSGRTDIGDTLVAYGIKNTLGIGLDFTQLGKFNNIVAAGRNTGSTALNLAYVAAGRFDAYADVGPSPWDFAAGMMLVREAGGFVTTLDGKPDPLYAKSILAGNPKIQPELIKLLAS